jgi:DNA-binding MarR family transcriptional regulator
MKSSRASTVVETDPPGAFDRDLGFALGAVLRAYVKAADVVMDEIPRGPRGYQILAAATHDSVESQTVLAQRLGIDRTVMVYLLDELEGAGLVERRPDPADRRNRHVIATAKGRKLGASIERKLRLVEDHVLGCLTSDEQEAFREMLHRLATRANDADPVSDPCEVVTELADVQAPQRGNSRRG